MDFATQHEIFCSGNVFSNLGWSRTSWTSPHNTRYSAQVMFLVISDVAPHVKAWPHHGGTIGEAA